MIISAGPGFTSYMFTWPGGQFWAGVISTVEFLLVAGLLGLVLRRPARAWLHHHTRHHKDHVSSELDRLQNWLAELLNGSQDMEHHTETIRQHVSAEIARLEQLITGAAPAVVTVAEQPEDPGA